MVSSTIILLVTVLTYTIQALNFALQNGITVHIEKLLHARYHVAKLLSAVTRRDESIHYNHIVQL